MFGRKKGYPDQDAQDEEMMLVETPVTADPPVQRQLPEALPQNVRRLPPPAARDEQTTLLGQGVTLEGKLRFKGKARLEGIFRGTIEAGDELEVGPEALLEADVCVGSLLIQGCVTGNVVAREGVEIHAGGRMKGNIRTPAFQVHRGALFTGHCEMGEP